MNVMNLINVINIMNAMNVMNVMNVMNSWIHEYTKLLEKDWMDERKYKWIDECNESLENEWKNKWMCNVHTAIMHAILLRWLACHY